MLQTLQTVDGDYAIKTTAVYDWYNYFKSGQGLLEDKPRSGRRSTQAETIPKVKQLVCADQCITVSEVANEMHILYRLAGEILTENHG